MLKFFISPAKKMVDASDDFAPLSKAVFLKEADVLLKYLQGLSFDELKTLYKANDKITLLNKERLATSDLNRALSCALFSYEGIQYQYMAPSVLEESDLAYLQDHLYILSGLYGLLKPFDGIISYRLEMQAKLKGFDVSNLYDYWKDQIYAEMKKEASHLINLASDEYSRVILPYVDLPLTNIHFKEEENGTYKEKGVYVKMARGAMMRYAAEHKIEKVEDLKGFNELNYSFNETLSGDTDYYFTRRSQA